MPPIDVNQATEEHFARIHRAALVLTGNPWDADDLAQETFLVLAREPEKFQGRSQLYTWLYGILLNLERQRRRRKTTDRHKLRVLWAGESNEQRTVPAAETPIEVRQWKHSLWAGVAQLPDGQRQALVLRFSEHLTNDEAALVLGCPVGTVKSRVFNGLASLRKLFDSNQSDARLAPKHPFEDLTHVG